MRNIPLYSVSASLRRNESLPEEPCSLSYLTCKTDIKALHCEAKRAKMGLPKDLYKANLMAWTVKKSVKTPRQKFVHDFLFGGQ